MGSETQLRDQGPILDDSNPTSTEGIKALVGICHELGRRVELDPPNA